MPVPDADFEFIRGLVKRESGIALNDDKRYLVKSRLTPLMEKNNFSNFRALVQHLKVKPADRINREIVDLMTTNESWFFRDHWPYECLKQIVFPDLAKRKSNEKAFHIWSAACSSGQEPYSLAMTVREAGDSIGGWNVRVHATDISPTMLEEAKAGKFTKTEVSRGLSPAQLSRFFTPVGIELQASDHLRSIIDFQVLNLIKAWPRLPQFDVVFLRNVLIYFDVATKEEIINRVVRVMNPGGYLFLGAGETMVSIKSKLEPVGNRSNTFYRLAAPVS